MKVSRRIHLWSGTDAPTLEYCRGVIVFRKHPSCSSILLASPILFGATITVGTGGVVAVLTLVEAFCHPQLLLLVLCVMFSIGFLIGAIVLCWLQTLVFPSVAEIDTNCCSYKYRCGLIRLSLNVDQGSVINVRAMANHDRNGWACRLQIQHGSLSWLWLPLVPPFVVTDSIAFRNVAEDVGLFFRMFAQEEIAYTLLVRSSEKPGSVTKVKPPEAGRREHAPRE